MLFRSQRGKILFMHQLIAARRCDAQHLCYRRRVQEMCIRDSYIRLDFLEQVVLYEVKRLACFASEYENDFIKAMIGCSAKVAENGRIRKQRELDALTARDRELDMLFERLYDCLLYTSNSS